MAKIILAADLGGTSCRFGFFEARNDGSLVLLESVWTETGSVSSFIELLDVLENSDLQYSVDSVDCFALAAAGPIVDDIYCKLTNVSWDVDFTQVRNRFDNKDCFLLNDFTAQAYGSVSQRREDTRLVLPGTAIANGTIGVIGAGTGLGKAFLIPNICDGICDHYVMGSSEGGHVTFPAESQQEIEFVKFCRERLGVSYVILENVVSGSGLSLIHEFLIGEQLSPSDVASMFDHESETLKWAARFYGRAARNFALDVLAVGGMFIAGGVAAKNPSLVLNVEFKKAFRNSPMHAELLEKIPVYLVEDEENGLHGAAYYAASHVS